MKLVFEAESEQERFDHVFDLYTGLYVSKQFDKINEMLQYCVENPMLLQLQPAVGMQLLILSKGEPKVDFGIRSQLYLKVEELYKKKFPDKVNSLKLIIGGLK